KYVPVGWDLRFGFEVVADLFLAEDPCKYFPDSIVIFVVSRFDNTDVELVCRGNGVFENDLRGDLLVREQVHQEEGILAGNVKHDDLDLWGVQKDASQRVC